GYARIRGVKGGLDLVLGGIDHLRAAGYNQISIGTVCMIENVDELVAVADLGRKLGVTGVRYTALQQDGFAKDRDPKLTAKYRDPAFLERLREEIEGLIRFKREHGLINNTEAYLRKIPESYLSDHYLPVPCIQGYYRIKILAAGQVSMCPIMQ